MRLPKMVTCACAIALASTSAWGGGFDLPDNGAEPMGRGGTFTAKADSPLALYYNVAGLARQRGTRVLLDGNLVLHDIAFTRDGTYPAATGNPSWVGKPYPTQHTSDSLFAIPFFGLSTDFGYFKRWTFAIGAFGPPGVGRNNYGVNTKGSEVATVRLSDGTMAPAPGRYDVTRTDLLIIYPTLAVGVAPMKWFDLGLAVHAVYASFDLANANVTRISNTACLSVQDPNCDAYGNIKAHGWSWGMTASAMVHPTPWLDIGLSFRPQIDVHAGDSNDVNGGGKIVASPPPALMVALPDAPVSFNTMLPNILRAGVRYVNRYSDDTERFDVELDATWENWSKQTDRWGKKWDDYDKPDDYKPDVIHSGNFMLGAGGELKVDLNHQYKDTFGLRLGGAYNHRLSDRSRLIGRLGFYYDSAATAPANTRLDFNTVEKYAATIGGGIHWRGLTVNLAYAFVFSPPRTVTNSAVTAVDSNFGTSYPDGYPSRPSETAATNTPPT